MARARNIKPGFFKNEDLAECSIWARYIFPGLWMLADREGRLEDRPKRIKGELLPFDTVEVDGLLAELARFKFIERYEVGGNHYIQILKFSEHQAPHYSEKPSVIPPSWGINSENLCVIKEGSQPLIKRGSQPPDSLNPDSLNPDSLNPEVTALSGKAPDAPPPKQKFREPAIRIIDFLNAKTGKAFQHAAVNVDMIAARLREGATEQDCKSVIARKTREWINDEKMREYLRPGTLFNREKFAQYVGELVVAPEHQGAMQ